MRILGHKGHLLRERARLVLRTRGGLERNQRNCHLHGLPHDPTHQGASIGTQYI